MWLTILLVILAIILAIIVIAFFNRIIRLENRIENAWAQIDVQLRRRADLIPNLLNTVKGYMKHEKEVLENVTKARTQLINAQSPQENIDADNMLTGALKTLFAVSEAYPDLKASTNFIQLQDELSHTENKVAFSRQHYNDSVLNYNNAVTTFPGIIFAGILGKSRKQMLQIPAEAREVPAVSFT
jgi:LemA protein